MSGSWVDRPKSNLNCRFVFTVSNWLTQDRDAIMMHK
jgi:hypothetical protein